MTPKQWFRWHEMLISAPEFKRELYLDFKDEPASFHRVNNEKEGDWTCEATCREKFNKFGIQIDLLPDWAQVLMDKALES